MNRFSPLSVINTIEESLDVPGRKLAAFLSRSTLRRNLFYVLITTVALAGLILLLPQGILRVPGFAGAKLGQRFYQHLLGITTLCLVWGGSLALLNLRPKAKSIALLTLSALCYFLGIKGTLIEVVPWKLVGSNAVRLCLTLTPLIFLSKRANLSRLTFVSTALFCLLVPIVDSILCATGVISPGFWALEPERIWMITLYILAERPLLNVEKIDWGIVRNYFFSPSHLYITLPVKISDLKEGDDLMEVRLRGLRDIFIGYCFVYIWYKLGYPRLKLLARDHFLGWFFCIGFVKYMKYYLLSNASIGIPTGLMRWFGWNIPNHYEVPLLAWSPLQRWRRWNTYFYHWLNSVIFVPVFRKTHNAALAVAGVFLATYFLHTSQFLYQTLYSHNIKPSLISFRYALFFCMHAILVYIALRWHKLFGNGLTVGSWAGVAVTWVLMCIIHFYAPL